MLRIRSLAVALLIYLAFCFGALAQPQDILESPFNSGALSTADARFLQTALAFEGYYVGTLDGKWGSFSQRALADYAGHQGIGPPKGLHLAALAASLLSRVADDGWQFEHLAAYGVSLLLPTHAIEPDPSPSPYQTYEHANSSAIVSLIRHTASQADGLHRNMFAAHALTEPPYTVRRAGFAVTSVRKADGKLVYIQSRLIGGAWSTVAISANPKDKGILNAIAGSITEGPTMPLTVSGGGYVDAAFSAALAYMEEGKEDRPASPSPVAPPPAAAGTGSGFFVSSGGYVLTNAHVVDGCGQVLVDNVPGRIVGTSADLDLALLQTAFDPGKAVAVFSGNPARLNSDVTVAGYPLAGFLGGLNVTRGSVSSLSGLGGAFTEFQITAPVQAGNSGGPVFGPGGEVVGIVVSKLDARRWSDAFGDIPQNVNFAIRAEMAKVFLVQHGVEPKIGNSSELIAPEALAESAARITAFIECRN